MFHQPWYLAIVTMDVCFREKLKPGIFTSGDTRKDCLTLFSKLIRTKNIESLQEEDIVTAKPGKTKLKVSSWTSTILIDHVKQLLISEYHRYSQDTESSTKTSHRDCVSLISAPVTPV